LRLHDHRLGHENGFGGALNPPTLRLTHKSTELEESYGLETSVGVVRDSSEAHSTRLIPQKRRSTIEEVLFVAYYSENYRAAFQWLAVDTDESSGLSLDPVDLSLGMINYGKGDRGV
jgi:hypothetical protein